jgi:hypothetical protein
MSTLKPTFVVLFFTLLLAGCAGAQLPSQLSEAPTATATLVPATPTPVPTPTEAVDTSPDESTTAAALELTETHVFSDFGYSIDYPAGWVTGTKNNLTIISELEEDQERIFSDDSSPEGYYVTLDHLDIERLYDLGLSQNPTLEDLLRFNILFLGMPQPRETQELSLFGVPTLRVKAAEEDQWGVAYFGVKDERFFLFVFTAVSEEALDEFMPTWNQMVGSIKPVEG